MGKKRLTSATFLFAPMTAWAGACRVLTTEA